MKKSILVASTMAALTSVAFADVSFKANARVYTDAVEYTSSSHKTRVSDAAESGNDDNGTWKFGKDTKHADDVTLNASGDKCGASIVFNVTGSNGTDAKGSEQQNDVNLTSYKLWTDFMDGKLRVNAGAYDSRKAANLNNDGNWGTNLSGTKKPGITTSTKGVKDFQLDSSNITNLVGGSKKTNNFNVEYKVNDKLNVSATAFITAGGYGHLTADNNDDNEPSFLPLAFNATYALDKDSKIAVSLKEFAGDGSYTAAKDAAYTRVNVASGTKAPKDTYYYYDSANSKWKAVGENKEFDPTDNTTDETYDWFTLTKAVKEDMTPAYTQWSFNVDYSNKKLIDGLAFEAGYTFGATCYNNSFKNGQDSFHNVKGFKESDLNEYAHGFDLRAIYTGIDKVSIQFLSNVSYKQATSHDQKYNSYAGLKTADRAKYANRHAYRADKKLDGVLAFWTSLGFDYTINPTTIFEVQTHLMHTGVNNKVTESKGKLKTADYLKNLAWTIRPGVKLQPSKQTEVHAGVQVKLDGFSSVHSTQEIKYTTSIPVGMRVKL